MEGATSFIFALAFTISAIYRIQVVHLDPLQLVLVGTVLEATCFLFEVPTGVVADTFSRRLSVIIGIVLLGMGFLVEGLLPVFWAVLLAQVIQGIGYTFTSGATEAWVAGEVGEENLSRVFTRAQQVGMATGLAGIAASVGIASISLNIAILSAGVLMVGLGLFLVFTMPETGFEPTPKGERTTWAAMGQTFTDGARTVRRKPMLITFLVIAAFFGMASEGFDRLWEAHFITNFNFPEVGGFTTVVWFGIINITATLVALGAMEISRRTFNTDRRETLVRTLIVTTALRTASILVFALAGNFWIALVGRLGKAVFASISGPLHQAWLAESIDPRVRATVLSMTSQVDALGQIAGGPAIGWVGRSYGVRSALAVSALLLVPLLPLYMRAQRQDTAGITQEEPVAELAVPAPAEG
jgi:MFS transporter, DHA3 family, tetracycline resistance protein